MPLMLGKLYDALKAAKVPEDKAREAAEEVATYEEVKSDVSLLKWMVGAVIALVLGVFWMQWQMVDRLAGIEGRITNVEDRLTTIENKLPPAS